MRAYLILVTSLMCASCAWVKPTEGGAEVNLLATGQVTNCSKKGATTSKTLGSILFIPRNEDKIYSELVTLAKNEAVVMGGNSIVPGEKIARGEREFLIYRCQ